MNNKQLSMNNEQLIIVLPLPFTLYPLPFFLAPLKVDKIKKEYKNSQADDSCCYRTIW